METQADLSLYLAYCGIVDFPAANRVFSASMDECCEGIRSKLPQYRNYIVIDITNQCAVHLKQVNDIPRLYRRTNREVGCDKVY